MRIETAGETEAEQRRGAARDQLLGRGLGACGRAAADCDLAKPAREACFGGHSDDDPQGHAA